MQVTDWVYLTGHAEDRWHERTTSPGIGPVVAWRTAERCEPSHLYGDEIRYHAGIECYLIAYHARNGMRLATVVPADQPDEPKPDVADTQVSGVDSGVTA